MVTIKDFQDIKKGDSFRGQGSPGGFVTAKEDAKVTICAGVFVVPCELSGDDTSTRFSANGRMRVEIK
jgi:hypothetical protein